MIRTDPTPRQEWNSLFDLMEQWRSEHPDDDDDACFEAVILRKPADRTQLNKKDA